MASEDRIVRTYWNDRRMGYSGPRIVHGRKTEEGGGVKGQERKKRKATLVQILQLQATS